MNRSSRLLFLLSIAAFFALAWSGQPDKPPYSIRVNWKKVEAVSKTSLSIQVCPEPPMRRGHPASKGIYRSLRDMKVNYARLQPWYPYPRLGVAELEPPTAEKTSWDFTVIDPIVIDFFAAAEGRPVMLNFSTIPQWMIVTDTPVTYPKDPNAICWNYSPGNKLRDTTMKELVDYFVRLVSWYTKGGFTDELGKYHRSGYHYKIDYWEVLNENDQDTQHQFTPEQLTAIYDAVISRLHVLDPAMKFSALALAFPDKGEPYLEHFLNPANHIAGVPLDMFSYHVYIAPEGEKWMEGEALEKQIFSYFDRIDGFLKTVGKLDAIKQRLSPHTKTYINEFGTLPVGNPSDPGLVIPDMYWPISSAMFAYGYVGMVKQGIDVVAIAELIDYPGQFAGTTITDWNTGKPNARYQGMKLLHKNFGPGDRLMETSQSDSLLLSQGFITAGGVRKILLVNKSNHVLQASVPGSKGATLEYVDESTGNGPPVSVALGASVISLRPHAVAVVAYH